MDDSQVRKFQKDLNGGLVALVLLAVLAASQEDQMCIRDSPIASVDHAKVSDRLAGKRAQVCLQALKGSRQLQGWLRSGGGAARRAIEVLVLDVTHEGDGRQRLAGGCLHQLLHRHLRTERMNMRAQPREEAAEITVGDLRIELRNIPCLLYTSRCV